MLTKKQIFKKIKEIFCEYEHNNSPVIVKTEEDSLYGDLGLDSLAVVELVMLCEKEFEIVTINDEEIDRLETINDLINLIEKYLQ